MGLVTATLAVVAVASTAASVDSQKRAGRRAKSAAEEQKKAGRVDQAAQQYERQQAIRQQYRERRLAQAQMESMAEASGGAGSSSLAGATASGATLAGMGAAFATGKTISNQAIGQYMQNAADYQSQQAAATATAGMWQQAAGLATTAAAASYGSGDTSPAPNKAVEKANYSRSAGKGGY
jgi:hypothetical protein